MRGCVISRISWAPFEGDISLRGDLLLLGDAFLEGEARLKSAVSCGFLDGEVFV